MYKTGDIVIVDTEDLFTGHVVVPGIIRYYDENLKVYEVNVFIPTTKEGNMNQQHIHWWPLSENEIKCKVGEVTVQNSYIGPGGLKCTS